MVEYLKSRGASNDIVNKDGQKPSFYAKDSQLKSLLSDFSFFELIECELLEQLKTFQGDDTETLKKPTEDHFIPSYLKNPQFHYAGNYGLVDNKLDQKTEGFCKTYV